MLLGELLNKLVDENNAADALAALNDVVLFAEIDEMAKRFDEDAPQYVATSASRFVAMASDEDWLGLMSAIERADDPAEATLRRMVRWNLGRDQEAARSDGEACGHGCGCGRS